MRRLLTGLLVGTLLLTAAGPVGAAATVEVVRHAGPTRTGTAADVAAASHPDGAEVVVLARADAYGDALAAAPLARLLDAPVLLTAPDALDPTTAAAIRSTGADAAVLVGALGPAVAEAVTGLGVTELTEVRGDGDWGTWAALAEAVIARSGATRALLVEGVHADPDRGWPDALAASAWAAAEGWPILLTRAGELPAATRDVLAGGAVRDVTLVGGEVAVSAPVADTVAGLVAGTVDRVAGADRYDTAVQIAARRPASGGIWIASGRNWPDALVAGPAVAADGGVLLLADPASLRHSPATATYLDARRAGAATTAHLVGGTAVLSEDLAREVATGVLTPPADGPEPGADLPPLERPAPTGPRNPAPPLEAAVPWSDPATWGGRVPQAGDVVTIPADTAVRLDTSPPPLRGIDVQGTLTFADTDLAVDVDWITVSGRLAIGTEQQPLRSRVTLTVHPRPGDVIAGLGEGPIVVDGGTLDLHGTPPAATWTRLAATAPAGATTLQLQDAPGWRPGDRVVVASTDLDPDHAEEATVVAVSGASVTLDRPLAHTHWGRTDVIEGRPVPQHAEVGSLSRNVVIRSSEEARQRRRGGHVIALEGSLVRIHGVELEGLGQAGQLARYPIHFHMMGSASGSYVSAAAIHHSFNRCLTLHGTHHVDVRDVVAYETRGHCFFLEDGAETANWLHCNLGLSTRRPAEGEGILASDATPATFWITNPTTRLTGNAAAGSDAVGFWYDLPEAPTGLSAGTDLDIRRLPFGGFVDNVAHSTRGGDWRFGSGVLVEDYDPPGPAVLRGLVAWKNEGFGAWAEGVDLHGAVLAENSIGYLGERSVLADSLVVGTTSNLGSGRPWQMTGAGLYHRGATIRDTTFVGFGATEHPWQAPRHALRQVSEGNNRTSTVQGLRFVDAAPLQITRPPGEHGPDLRTAALADLDGSLAGQPALVVADHPLLHADGCTRRPDLGAWTCPPGWRMTWVLAADLGGGVFGDVGLVRDDGASAPLRVDADRRRAHLDVLAGRGYRLTAPTAHSGHLELIISGDTEAFVDLAVPWPHPEAHVYDGWGRWRPLAAGSDRTALQHGGFWLDRAAGLLHVRHTLDDLASQGTWQRLELCAQAWCGAAAPG